MKNGFRADIEGMRAIAIGAVLLAHAGIPFAAGGYVGVDVFFVISGFLITGLLVGELERSGRISLRAFYARRVRRLLPLAALVLAATVVLAQLLLSPVENDLVARDVLAASVYVVNWRFMAQSVDYFADDVTTSPVLHYWTLAIEEQFYLVWPALILLATLWVRRSGRDPRPALWALIAVSGGASLAYGIAFASASPDAAYFSTPARGWELALGAALALLPRWELPRAAAAALAGAGLAAIAAAVLAYDATTPFPGTAALLPTLGAAALIVAGGGSRLAGPSRFLALAPLRHVGRISYAWYLWHWPLLVFAAHLWGPLSVSQGIAVVAASYVPTVVSHRLVERPIHRSARLRRRPRLALGVWSGATALAAGSAALLLMAQPSVTVAPAGEVRGASALYEGEPVQRRADVLRPEPRDAHGDRGPLPADGCFLGDREAESPECVYGDERSRRTVVLFGDSHAMHYFPPLERVALRRGWRLVALTKAGCPPNRAVKADGDDEGNDCPEWRAEALERIERERPHLVVVSGATAYRAREDDGPLEGEANRVAMAAGYASVLAELRESGTDVVALKDPPVPPHDVPSCVAESLERLDRCAFELPGGETFEHDAIARVPGTRLVDLTRWICPGRTCRGVIGDAIVYRNKGHLTATFAATLAGPMERRMLAGR